MKLLAPILAFLAACGPPPPDLSPVRDELAALRKEVQELRKLLPPDVETVEAMDDLAREVKKLREKAPPPAPPASPIKEAPLPMSPASGGLVGGVGGTQGGVNDLYWILTRLAVDGEERTVLALYQARSDGRGFKLTGVRWVGPDLQIVEFGQDKPHVKEILEELRKTKK